MSERSKVISRLLNDRAAREAYIGAKLKVLIPSQIRALRLKSQISRQEDLASAAEMKQSRISAMETPGAVNFNLETLVRVASALRVSLKVEFIPFSEMVRWENDFSQDDFNVVRIDDDAQFIEGGTVDISNGAALIIVQAKSQLDATVPVRATPISTVTIIEELSEIPAAMLPVAGPTPTPGRYLQA